MSGIVTIATIASAAAAVGGTAYSVYNGQKQSDTQQKALVDQERAQQDAKSSALNTERTNAQAQAQANQKTPDIAAILSNAASASKGGVSSTLLTGSNGAGSSSIGKSTLLGS